MRHMAGANVAEQMNMHALYAVSPRTIELQAGAEAASANEVACGKRGTSPHHWQPAHLHLRRHAPTPISSITSARVRDLCLFE